MLFNVYFLLQRHNMEIPVSFTKIVKKAVKKSKIKRSVLLHVLL